MRFGPEARPWITVAAMSLPLLLVTIDFYGLSVALPAIGRALDVSTTVLQWTMNGFFLALAAPMLAVGRLADLIGRRRVLLVGVVVFTVGSAASGLAPGAVTLIAGRCLQGVGAAMFIASGISIVSNAFPAERRGLGIAVVTAVSNVGSAIGPLVGGFLTDTLSWRWFFFMNVPLAIAAIVLTLLFVDETRDETAHGRIDIAGFGLATAGFVALVLGIQLGNDLHWHSWAVAGPIVLGILLLAGFAVLELRLADPLVDLRLFTGRNVLATMGVAFFGNYTFTAVFFFPTLYLQNLLRLSPLETGTVFLAFSLAFVGGSLVAGAAVTRIGERTAMAGGMTLMALCFALLAGIRPDGWGAGLGLLLLALAVAGIGEAFAYNISTSAGMSAIPEDKAGAASGAQNAIRQIGSVFGVAVTGAWFAAIEKQRLNALIWGGRDGVSAADRPEIKGLLSGSELAREKLEHLVPQAAGHILGAVNESFLAAMHGGMLLCVAAALIGVVSALLYRGKPRQVLPLELPTTSIAAPATAASPSGN